jgi:hypothetical protein
MLGSRIEILTFSALKMCVTYLTTSLQQKFHVKSFCWICVAFREYNSQIAVEMYKNKVFIIS